MKTYEKQLKTTFPSGICSGNLSFYEEKQMKNNEKLWKTMENNEKHMKNYEKQMKN